MSRKLAHNVFQLARGASRTLSLSRLRREGHSQVPVLRLTELEALVSRAVDDTLSALGLQLADETVAGLSEEARLRFLGLVKERDALRETVTALERGRDELSRNQDSLRGELMRAETELDDVRQAPATSATDHELMALIETLGRDLRGVLGAAPGADRRLVDEALAVVEQALASYRQLLAARAKQEHEAKVVQLQRRIARLERKLAESEDLLERARAASRGGEPGLLGLAPALRPGDSDYTAKRELLDEIFRLNVELQRIIKQPVDR